MHSFKIVPGNNASAAPVEVSLAVPGSWQTDTSDPSGPVFTVPGLASGSRVSLAAVELSGSADLRMSKAIDMQDLDDGQRTELSDGRVWVQQASGTRVHARVFAPYGDGVVMGVAMLRDGNQLAEIRTVLETMTVAAP